MAKAREKKAKREKLARKQRRVLNKPFSGGDPGNLDSQLKNIGLCTKNITGDGNCLFRSLSDQYHGHDGNHKAIRQEVCQYLEENEETYKFFVEDDQSFEHHVGCMSQDATFGGNMELAAFAKLKKVDIKVYQPGMIYIINGVDDENEEEEQEEKEQRHILHIAYHSWEHYSSIRNIDGPYSGPPEIKAIEQPLDDENDTNKDESQANNEEEELDSKEKVVRSVYPDASLRKIRRLLIKHKGNPDKVIDAIYEAEHKKQGQNGKEETKLAAYSEVAAETAVVDTISKTMISQKIVEEAVSTEHKDEKDDNIVTDNDSGFKLMTEENTSDDGFPTDKEEESSQHQQQEQQQPSTEVNKKPKKLSAAERKKEQKRRQKEHKLMKDRAKAARKAGCKQANLQDEEESDVSKAVVVPTQSMKEMYI